MTKAHLQEARQPLGLYCLSFVVVWERFAFYTMRTILILYMVQVIGFHKANAYVIYAAFSAILYLTPILGGTIADRWLGPAWTVLLGGITLALGYLCLAEHGSSYFYLGLATISIGSGLFMPNIASMVAHLYQAKDIRREGGFSIFYTAINMGAFIPPIVDAAIILSFGWRAAFLVSAGTVLFAVLVLITVARPNFGALDWQKSLKIGLGFLACLCLALFILPFVKCFAYTNILLTSIGILILGFIILKSFSYDLRTRKRLWACLLLILLSIIFSVLYQQAGMSLTIYTEYNVNRQLGHWVIPTVAFQSFNPFFVIVSGPLLAKLWGFLGRHHKNPSVSVKFALGTAFMGLGFVLLYAVVHFTAVNGRINYLWVVLSYALQTLGEMLVSPIGLSMVADLSPIKMIGLMMGAWYFATAIANALAGVVSAWTTVASDTNVASLTSPQFAHVFGVIGLISILTGVLIYVMAPVLTRMTQST